MNTHLSDQPISVDVIIVGGGLSGIGAAVHLQKQCPDKKYILLEARDSLGGTWDLFRYPGVRSDSDMHTLGFSFKPWPNAKAIADGPSIKKYIEDTADEYHVTPHIKLNEKVVAAEWQSQDAHWLIETETYNKDESNKRQLYRAKFLFMGSGYYRYDKGYCPELPDKDTFSGNIVHPQFWPEDLDYTNKKIVIIGSGATAVTLVPELAKRAASVTMLQRSPTYVVARPSKDLIGNMLKTLLPNQWAYSLTRWKNILLGRFFNDRVKKNPAWAKKMLLKMAKKHLPVDFDMRHLTPTYNPWDQRICLAPDGDFFEAITHGRASIVTDKIQKLTENGIQLKSGQQLDADIIVTATGLELATGANITMTVDGKTIHFGDAVSYKGVMFSNVPNFILVFGYTMASWTLKADLAAQYFCRLIKELTQQQADFAVPVVDEEKLTLRPMLDFSSGYIQRAVDILPKQGTKPPWQINQDYLTDRKVLLKDAVKDGVLFFGKANAGNNRLP